MAGGSRKDNSLLGTTAAATGEVPCVTRTTENPWPSLEHTTLPALSIPSELLLGGNRTTQRRLLTLGLAPHAATEHPMVTPRPKSWKSPPGLQFIYT